MNRAFGLGPGSDAGSGEQLRQETAARAKALHLARALVSLEDILVPPSLLVPALDPSDPEAAVEDTLTVLPNLPDWSVLSGVYRAPTIPLAHAVAAGTNLLITGELGAGKSTALAYLALRMSRRTSSLGTAADMAPLWIHAADLPVDRPSSDPLPNLIEAMAYSISPAVAQRLFAYVRSQLTQRNGLLLLDGLDELGPGEVTSVATWLVQFHRSYPGNRVIAAGPPRGYDGLAQTGLLPTPLAPWGEHEQRTFLTRWAGGWAQHVVPRLGKGRIPEVDPVLIRGWLTGSLHGLTPLEATLRIWSAYAGDALGAGALAALEAHVQRLVTPEERARAQTVAANWMRGHQGAVPDNANAPAADLVDAGLLVRRPGGKLAFSSPAIGAYLAAHSMARGDAAAEMVDPDWLPGTTALSYFAGMGDLGPQVRSWLQVSGDPLEEKLLLCGRILRDAAPKAEWRNDVLRALAKVLHDPSRPYGLRLRVVHALVRSGEPSVKVLFRRMLTAEATSARVLSALGCGGTRDEESVAPMLRMLQSETDPMIRRAACLALAVIGSTPAMEGLGRALLQGDEPLRLAVAEALACSPDEGYAMLKDAVEVASPLTRRAAAFGLARIPEAWVAPTLEKLQLNDKEWVVRGAAAEAIERRTKPRHGLRPPVLEPSQLPWLVAFAARAEMGVAPGRAAREMLRRALNTGNEQERIAALDAISWAGGDQFSVELGQALNGKDPPIRDAAFEALWRLRAQAPLRGKSEAGTSRGSPPAG